MRVYNFVQDFFGYGIKRIAKKLEEYAPPWLTFVKNRQDADIVLIHAIGSGEVKDIKSSEDYVVFQYCYKTADGDKTYWNKVWKDALQVVSYYDLRPEFTSEVNFTLTPLGADLKDFSLLNRKHRYNKVFATGHLANTESIDTVWEACKATGNTLYHTGENFNWHPNYTFYSYLETSLLNKLLNNTQYVACLRKIEGFEMMGIEGLFAGVRPIVLDIPSYNWYRKYSYTVRTEHLLDDLIDVLNITPNPIEGSEYQEVVEQFSWKKIVSNIYEDLKGFVNEASNN